MIDKGQLLSRHDFSKINWGILAVAAALLSIGGTLLLLSLLSGMEESRVLALLQIGAATISLGGIMLVTRHFLRPTLTYRLYEHGVRVSHNRNHKERFIAFEKIADIYRFRYLPILGSFGGIVAFRSEADQRWFTVFSNIAQAKMLRDTLLNQHIRLRGAQALNAMYQGNAVDFRYLNGKMQWVSLLLRGNLHQARSQTLRLSAKSLCTPQREIAIAQIHSLENDSQKGRILLLDNQGQVLATLCYFSLLSADLFIALLEHMIASRIPAYHNPAMTK
ncbi:hypothetical protein ACQKDS_09355 [Serratia sp. NPDC078593]|uniref:hypothetical protein n=1 Tax=unclassified Serratia (in: enterobacteria) TaxID=2647522 RepID=UPI0037D842DC